MNWVVYIISFIVVVVGSQLVRHDEPIWGGVLLGLAIATARMSGLMAAKKYNSR